MIYELRTYQLAVGGMADYLDLIRTKLLPMLAEHGIKPIGFWTTDIGTLNEVVRTRIYVRDIADWEAVARVHGEIFADIRPVNTLGQAALVGEEYLVEIEAEAIIGAGPARQSQNLPAADA